MDHRPDAHAHIIDGPECAFPPTVHVNRASSHRTIAFPPPCTSSSSRMLGAAPTTDIPWSACEIDSASPDTPVVHRAVASIREYIAWMNDALACFTRRVLEPNWNHRKLISFVASWLHVPNANASTREVGLQFSLGTRTSTLLCSSLGLK
jgi:hypothetical protein